MIREREWTGRIKGVYEQEDDSADVVEKMGGEIF